MARRAATKKSLSPALVALRDIVCHPLRIRSLIVLTERNASVGELAERFGADKGTVAYHVGKLHEAGAIEVVGTRKTRGPEESIYRAVQRPLLSEAETAAMGAGEVAEWLERILALIIADTTASFESGAFTKRDDHNLVRFPTTVDLRGWGELGDLLEATLEKAMDIQAKSDARRIEDPGSEVIQARFVTMLFELEGSGAKGGD